MNLPADVANQALDAAGVDFTIGDLQEGTKPAQVMLRAYGQCLRQLLRAAHWDFARVQLPLVLLGDRSGNTPNVSTMVPEPWYYAYQYPIDCMKLRFIPWNYTQIPGTPAGNIAIPTTVPLTTGTGAPSYVGRRLRPSRFLIGNDPNYPAPDASAWWETQGQSPVGSTIVMSNVKDATAVYTRFLPYPSTWDALFRAAMVAFLASEIALPLTKDKKLGMTLRKENIEIAKAKIKEARVIDGNEGFYSSDIRVDWMQTRRVGGWGSRSNWGGGGGWDDGAGYLFNSWDSCGFADGSAY